MEKSIESIWTEGFLKSSSLSIPQINNLYERKSMHVIDKMIRTMKMDLWLAPPIAVLVSIINAYMDGIWIGLLTGIVIMIFFFIGLRKYNELIRMGNDIDCYHYLKSIQEWLKTVFKFYTRVIGIGAPFFLLLMLTITMVANDAFSMNDFAEPFQLIKIGFIYILLPVAFHFIAVWIYQLSVKVIYGGILNKLNELVHDMEELNSGET